MDPEPKKTPLYNEHIRLSGKMVEFAGYSMPVWYQGKGQGVIEEHLCVRNNVGIFDLSHMGELFFYGSEAYDFLQFVLCNDLRKIGNGGCQYTLLPTEDGGVVDDLIIYQITPESYFAVVNAVNIQKDHDWLTKWKEERGYEVKIDNRSDELSLIAIQGPRSEEVLTEAGFRNVHCYLPFTHGKVKFGGYTLYLSATGYTGERGFELIVDNEHAEELWETLMEVGRKFDLKPVGLGARDSLRLEAGLCLYGHELDLSTSVLEANLAWTVCMNKNFLGKEKLQEQSEKGLKKILFGIKTEREAGIPRQNAKIFDESGMDVGWVTSGGFSPVLNCGIAFCYLKPEFAQEGRKLQVEIRGKKVPALASKPPFVKHRLYKP